MIIRVLIEVLDEFGTRRSHKLQLSCLEKSAYRVHHELNWDSSSVDNSEKCQDWIVDTLLATTEAVGEKMWLI